MRIALTKLDGKQVELVTQESFDFKINGTYSLSTAQGRYLIKVISLRPLAGVEVTTIESYSLGGWSLVTVAWALMIGAALWVSTLRLDPDNATIQAAKVLTAKPEISQGHVAASGCRRGEMVRFDVKDQGGREIGWVCQGKGPFSNGATPVFGEQK